MILLPLDKPIDTTNHIEQQNILIQNPSNKLPVSSNMLELNTVQKEIQKKIMSPNNQSLKKFLKTETSRSDIPSNPSIFEHEESKLIDNQLDNKINEKLSLSKIFGKIKFESDNSDHENCEDILGVKNSIIKEEESDLSSQTDQIDDIGLTEKKETIIKKNKCDPVLKTKIKLGKKMGDLASNLLKGLNI